MTAEEARMMSDKIIEPKIGNFDTEMIRKYQLNFCEGLIKLAAEEGKLYCIYQCNRNIPYILDSTKQALVDKGFIIETLKKGRYGELRISW